MNRKNAFFQKHILNTKNETDDKIRDKIMEQVFGFNRVRKSVKAKCESIFEYMLKK